MLLKHYLVTTLLALGSVAFPSPGAESLELEAKRDEGELLESRTNVDCGRDASWDHDQHRCVCRQVACCEDSEAELIDVL